MKAIPEKRLIRYYVLADCAAGDALRHEHADVVIEHVVFRDDGAGTSAKRDNSSRLVLIDNVWTAVDRDVTEMSAYCVLGQPGYRAIKDDNAIMFFQE